MVVNPMMHKFRTPFLFAVILMFLMDLYTFQAIRTLMRFCHPKTKTLVYILYWVVSVSSILTFVFLPFLQTESWPKNIKAVIFSIIIGLFLAKFIVGIFLLLDDIRRGFEWIMEKLMPRGEIRDAVESSGITRSVFISRLSLLVGGSFFATIIYGFSNKYNYQIRRHQLKFDRLPSGFRGLKIVHISDIHSGSFTNLEKVEPGVRMV
ncbi:MAG: metallophosphoesterase, partial [Chitinophagaceae bacterium]